MLLTSLLLLAAAPSAAPPPLGCAPRREAVTVRLADFDSPAEIASPPAGEPARGLAVLFAGSDVADLDSAIVDEKDAIVSRPLRQVADRLACAGVVTLRYNKRYVSAATTVDRARFDRLNGVDLAADGRAALAFARARPELARLPVALVGWSEGTTVAMAVAAAEPQVQAVVLMAPVVPSNAAVAQAQYGRIGRPYLMRYAVNGTLDADAIARADAGPGGMLAHIFVRMFRGFQPGERVNPLLDANKDGRIAFTEADPVIAGWYADNLDSGLGMSATGRALPGVEAAWSAASPPILMLQGLNDGMVDPAPVRAFADRPEVKPRVTLRLYPKLGHALGPSASPIEDGLLPTAPRPLDDMADWLVATLTRPNQRGT